MADEIKQPRNVGIVLPPNASRGADQRKRQRPQLPRDGRKDRERRPDDDRHHQVDEYV